MKQGRKSYLLRINEGLWNDINEWASQEFRSMNGQMELILQRAVDERKKEQRRRQSPGTPDNIDGDKSGFVQIQSETQGEPGGAYYQQA